MSRTPDSPASESSRLASSLLELAESGTQLPSEQERGAVAQRKLSKWASTVSAEIQSRFREPSQAHWAVTDADRRLDALLAGGGDGSLERVKRLYLKSIELALAELRMDEPSDPPSTP